MFCKYCGKEVIQGDTICPNCGGEIDIPVNNMPPPQPMPSQQAQPVVYAPPGGYYVPPYPPMQYVDPDPPANGGLIALSIIIPIVGIILGIIKMSDGQKRAGKTYLLSGLIVIGVNFLFVIFYYIFFFNLLIGIMA